MASSPGSDFVVARVELELNRPVQGDVHTLQFSSGVVRVGDRSVVVTVDIAYGNIRAATVMVAFDATTSASRHLTPDERTYFNRHHIDPTRRPA